MALQNCTLDYSQDDVQSIVATGEVKVEPLLQLTAGPTNCSPRTLKALSLPTFVPVNDQNYNLLAKKLVDEIREMVKHVFQTKNKYTFCEQNAGHGGMETIFTNLADPGEKVLIAVGGFWGERAVAMAKHYGLDVVTITCPPNDVFSFEELEKEIIKHKPVLLFITHGETSTCTLQPIEGLSEICHKHGCLLAVDAIITFAAVPIFVDRWNIDAIVGAPQKALSAPPGLVFLSFSDRAIAKMEKKKVNPPFYLDVKLVSGCWKCPDKALPSFHYTWNTNMMCAVREALVQLLEQGLVNSWKKQQQISEYLWEKLEKMNLKLWIQKKEIRLPNVTSVILPEGIDWRKLCKYTFEVHKTDFSFGIGPTYNKCIRIGIMGYNLKTENVDKGLKVLADAIEKYPIYSKQYEDSEKSFWDK